MQSGLCPHPSFARKAAGNSYSRNNQDKTQCSVKAFRGIYAGAIFHGAYDITSAPTTFLPTPSRVTCGSRDTCPMSNQDPQKTSYNNALF